MIVAQKILKVGMDLQNSDNQPHVYLKPQQVLDQEH